MARIRTIKPEFFRHELLQALEQKHAEARPMLVFAALWGHCDKAGDFLWKTRLLALDILPFLALDLSKTLQILVEARLVLRYSVRGVEYGNIPSFRTHQRLNGKEAADPARFPPPPGKKRGSNGAVTGQRSGSNRAAGGQQRGTQGREGKGRERNKSARARASPPRLAVDNSEKAKSALQKKPESAIAAHVAIDSAATSEKATA